MLVGMKGRGCMEGEKCFISNVLMFWCEWVSFGLEELGY